MKDLILDSGSSASLLDQQTIDAILEAISLSCTSLGEDCWIDPDDSPRCIEL